MLQKKVFTATSDRDLVFSLREGAGVPLVFLNGLSDSMDSWSEVLDLSGITRPCLLVDLPGQGDSLLREQQSGKSFNYRLSIDDQVTALNELLGFLNIEKFGLVGFSYGGGVALSAASLFKDQVEELILMLPFILRLDLSFPLSRLWVAQFDLLKSLTPKNFRHPYHVMEKSYERFIEHYMNFRYLKRIPDEKNRQIAVDLSRGIMDFNSFEVLSLIPDKKLVLLTSGMDTLVPQSLYQEFWYRIPDHKKRAWVHAHDGEHLIMEQAPEFVAHFLKQAVDDELHGVKKVTLMTKQRASSL